MLCFVIVVLGLIHVFLDFRVILVTRLNGIRARDIVVNQRLFCLTLFLVAGLCHLDFCSDSGTRLDRQDRPAIAVLNKQDLAGEQDVPHGTLEPYFKKIVPMCAKDAVGLQALTDAWLSI